jgi:UDP-N-acetylglucosamine 3-dehydrogenase
VDKKLRVGIAGLGMMGRNHLRVLSSLESVDVVAVLDPLGTPEGLVDKKRSHRNLDDFLAMGLDYCVVAVPTNLHEEIALSMAENGVHVLLEKPIAHSITAAVGLVEKFESSGLVGAIGHIERFNAAVIEAKKRISDGFLGEIFQVATRRQGPFPSRIVDVGVVKDLATHDIDLTCWVTASKFSHVSAYTIHKTGRDHEDLVTFSGKLDSGIVTNHLINWLSPFKERVTVITGERGVFAIDTLTADLTFYENGDVESTWEELRNVRGFKEGNVTRYAIPKSEPLMSEHLAFIAALKGDSSRIVTFRDGLEVLTVAEAVIESAKSGTAVSL